jgi:YVTN family beta-propeller protein
MDIPDRRTRRQPSVRVLRLAALAAALACGEPRLAADLPAAATASRVDVFISAPAASEPAIGLRLAAVSLRDESGHLFGLPRTRSELLSREAGRRVQVAGGSVPAAGYATLVLELEAAWLDRDGQRTPLRLAGPPPGVAPAEGEAPPATAVVEVPLRLLLGRRDAASLFLEWDVGASLQGDLLRPAFGVTLETPRVRLGLLYVADASTGLVLSVERGSGEVVGTARAGAGATALALSRDRRDLFVANAADGSVSVLDTQGGSARLTLPVRLGAGTSDIVLTDGDLLVATCNPELDTVSLFETRTGARVADVRVGRRPVRLASAPSLHRLFVANARSDEVTVIDTSSRSVVASVKVEAEPTDLALSRDERELYVVHRTSPNLLVLDAGSLQVLQRLHVGDDASAVLADRRFDRVYVARGRPAELAVVERSMNAVTRRIAVAGRIEALAQPPDGPLVWGAVPSRAGLSVVDVLVGREQALLACGAAPAHVLAVD